MVFFEPCRWMALFVRETWYFSAVVRVGPDFGRGTKQTIPLWYRPETAFPKMFLQLILHLK